MTDNALQFDGTQNYLDLGTLGSLGSNLGNGFYYRQDIKTSKTDKREQGIVWTGSPSNCAIIIGLNNNSGGGTTSGCIRLYTRDQTGKQLAGATTSATNFNDGAKHIIEVIAVFSTNTITIKVDGVSKAITYTAQQTPSSFTDFNRIFPVGARNNAGSFDYYLASIVDNFQIGTSLSALYGSYSMDEGSGTTTANAGSVGGTATLTKGAGDYPAWVTGLSGPINLKSINGLAKASIKADNGLSIASVKTVNGLG